MSRKCKTTLPSSGEKARIEQLLHDSEGQYQLLFELNPVPMFIFDENTFKFLDVNEAALQLYGYPRKAFLRMTTKDIQPPEDVPHFLRVLKESQPMYVGKWRHVKRDGSVFDVAVTVSSLPFAGRKRRLVLVSDITNRKRTEAALQKSEEKLRSVFCAAPTGIGVVVNRVFTEVNQRLCDMIGYTYEELISRSSRMIYPTDADYEYVGREKYDQIAKTGTGAVETRFRRKDGRVIDVLLSSAPLDAANLSQGVTFTALDITERKRMEEALQKLSKMQSVILDNSTVGIAFVRNRIFEWVNPRMPELFGIPIEQFQGASTRIIYPDDEAYKKLGDESYSLLAQGKKVAFEIETRKGDGSLIWCRIEGNALDTSNPQDGSIWILEDVTERKRTEVALGESEARYHAFFEQAADAVVVFDPKTLTILDFNDEACRRLGYTREEFAKLKISDFELIESVEEVKRHSQKVTMKGTEVFETKHRTKAGAVLDIEIRAKAIHLGEGAVIQGVWRDITKRKEAEESLRKMAAELEQRVQERTAELQRVNSSLLREMAQRRELERQVLEIGEREKQRIGEDLHDGLGQSLTGLGYLISAVQERLENKSVPEAAELERITRLVEKTKLQIHDMAWGLFTKELRKGGIAAALKELAIETRDVFGISCRFIGSPAIRLANTNVANQVYRIAQEAVNNAAKHSKGKTINIRLMRQRGRFVLTVRDSGIGISQTAGKAIGMGQRIMKYRAEMIGATLKIDAIPGKGTTVTCVVPSQIVRIRR